MTQAALAGLNPFSPAGARATAAAVYANATDVELDSRGARDGAARATASTRASTATWSSRARATASSSGTAATWETYDSDLTARAPDLTASLGHPA